MYLASDLIECLEGTLQTTKNCQPQKKSSGPNRMQENNAICFLLGAEETPLSHYRLEIH